MTPRVTRSHVAQARYLLALLEVASTPKMAATYAKRLRKIVQDLTDAALIREARSTKETP